MSWVKLPNGSINLDGIMAIGYDDENGRITFTSFHGATLGVLRDKNDPHEFEILVDGLAEDGYISREDKRVITAIQRPHTN